jgi:hypothetical protein
MEWSFAICTRAVTLGCDRLRPHSPFAGIRGNGAENSLNGETSINGIFGDYLLDLKRRVTPLDPTINFTFKSAV